jgi:tetratricopeptide (TPR) repeat protein
VVATLRTTEDARLSAASALTQTFLASAKVVSLPRSELDAVERARRLFPAANLSLGIGAWFSLGPLLMRALPALEDLHPTAATVVYAAFDLCRMGVARALTRDELRRLFEIRAGPDAPDEFDAALIRAAQPFEGLPGFLMERASDARFELAPRIVELLEVTGIAGEVPASGWAVAVATSDPDDALAIGAAAIARGVPEMAEQAWQRATAGPDAVVAETARLLIANLLLQRGDLQRATEELQRVCDGKGKRAGEAALALAEISANDPTRLDEAEQRFREVTAEAGTEVAGWAALKLADFLRHHLARGDAVAVYQQLISQGDPDLTPWAQLYLGVHLTIQLNAQRLARRYSQRPDLEALARDADPFDIKGRLEFSSFGVLGSAGA